MQHHYYGDITRYTVNINKEISKLAKKMWMNGESFIEKATFRKKYLKNIEELG